MNFSADQERWAEAVTRVTLLGVFGAYPYPSGNCFSVRTGEGDDLKIVNMNHENLRHLLDADEVTWPIRVLKIGARTAVVHDERIPDGAYAPRFCEACCPRDLLPAPQVLATSRRELRGQELPHNVTGGEENALQLTTRSVGGAVLLPQKGAVYDWTIPGIGRCVVASPDELSEG